NISVDGIDVTPFANISLSNLNHTPAEPLKMGYHNFTIKVETDKYTKGFGHQFFNIRYIYNPSPSCTVFTNNPTIRANISVGYGNISSVIMILDGINVTSNATIYPSYIEYTPIAPLNNGSHSVSLEVKSTRNISDNENWAFSVNLPMPCTPPSGRSGGGGGGYSKILFASNRSGNFDLWMMNLDGSGQEQITYDPSNESSPAWVGSKVVFVSDKSGSKDIWSMDINGSNKKQLTSSVLDENMPSWSYIGGILYTAGKDGVFNLEAMNTNGTGKINITNSSASVIDPAHSSVKAGFLNSPWNMGILYSSATKGESSIYLMNFEEIGPKVKFWKLGEGYSLQVAGIDTGASPSQAWFKFQRNGTTRDDRVVRVGEAFSLFDNQRVILNAVLDRIGSSDLDYYFEVELVNVTQYSSIDGSPLFANATKILVSKIILNELLVSFPGIDMPPSSGGGGPSGGGGGGGASGENYSNIVLREKYEEAIYKDKTTSYRFKNASNPLMFVNITGNVNAGLVTAMAEILKGTSTLVKEAAPGIVYKNINLWVGTSGFATSKNIKGATIMFRVEDSWIDSNNFERIEIKLVKWEGGKWITLETSEKRRDGTFIYFEAKTTGFSPFAITGIRSIPSAAPPQITTPSPTGIPVTTAAQAPAMNLALIAGVIILITIVVVMYLWRRK
ncbi:MAG TPA: PGF-pre-PGF domain-containing protein, partial [candidate division Zixibacteria bacterium]|nr:PGF-pre-PGF domain-containing protein [candidate division Zixibacteria bacterium]